MMDATDLAVLSLTSRILPAPVETLSSSEFWHLTRRGPLLNLPGQPAAEIADRMAISLGQAGRLATLLERRTAMALALEQLEHAGTWTVTGLSAAYPHGLVDRLGDLAPPVLHGLGDRSLLAAPNAGIVGSGDLGAGTEDAARAVAAEAVAAGRTVVSGGGRGVDRIAMNSAFEAGGRVVGVLADSLERAASRPSMRQAVSRGQICLVTPYAPRPGSSAGGASGPNQLIYALSEVVVVVRTADGGDTWTGATQALTHSWSPVLTWTGAGSAAANKSLVTLGARAVSSIDALRLALIREQPDMPVPAAGSAEDQVLPIASAQGAGLQSVPDRGADDTVAAEPDPLLIRPDG